MKVGHPGIGGWLGVGCDRGWRYRTVARAALAALVVLWSTACLERPPGPTGPSATVDAGSDRASPPVGEVAEGLVVAVIDGDTIRVDVAGVARTVRYIGIDAPERGDRLGAAATEANRRLVGDALVLMEKDVSEADSHGRWLRYVYVSNGIFVNGELVRQGLARAQAYPPDTSRQAMLAALQEEARAAGRGMWGAMGSAEVQVRIAAVDKRAEVALLTNEGDEAQEVTGWTLVSERGQEVCTLEGRLDPGETLWVWARAEDADRGGYNCGFLANVWNNSEPDPAALYDAEGRLVDIFP